MRLHVFSLVLVSAMSLTWAGCGDDGGGSGGSGGQGTTTTTSGSGGGGGSGGGTGGAGGVSSSPPQAPMMKSAVPMAGALHVSWENVTLDCDTIELDRNHDAGAYETVYTLTGQATSQHDTSAIPPGSYCYKARCTKGAEVSPDSNEVCGTP